MRTTFVALVGSLTGLVAASLLIACDDDKKPTETAPSTTATVSAAATTPPPPPKPKPEEVITKALKTTTDAWASHDAAKVAALYESTGKLTMPGVPDITGKDALTADAKQTFTAYPDFKVAISRAFLKSDTAVFEWVVTAKNDGPNMGKPATGRPVGIAGLSVSTYDDDGLVKEEHRYFDLPTLMSQLDPKAKAGTFRAPMALPTAATETMIPKGTPEEGKALDAAKALYAAFEKKGSDMTPFVTEETVLDDYTFPAPFKGAKGTKDYVGVFWTALPDLTATKALQFADGDFVITEGTVIGTQKGPFGPIKATNKPVTSHFVDVFQMKDGKAVHLNSYGNSAEILIAIGAMPPMTAAPAASITGAPFASPAPSAKAK